MIDVVTNFTQTMPTRLAYKLSWGEACSSHTDIITFRLYRQYTTCTGHVLTKSSPLLRKQWVINGRDHIVNLFMVN